jgi:FAD/FMN-containing dehydrogenase
MTQTLSGGIDALRAAVDGLVVVPGDDGYDAARKLWNAAIDRRPAAVVECSSVADVSAAIRFARAEGLEIAVRGGGHSMPGLSSVDGGLVIDLRLMNTVHVDPEARRARAQGGALLGDVDAATQEHGLAVPAGVVSHTGVGGLTLGGGMGWLTRLGGLSIDHLLSAEVVLADGRVVRASDEQHSDLFWAIRGGGGNFGVVTEFEFGLIEVGPVVQFGLFFWPEEQGRQALRLVRDLTRDLPRTLNLIPAAALTAPAAPFVPAQHVGKVGHALLLTGFGDPVEHAQVVERIRAELPPLFDLVTPMPYTAVQQLLDEANAWGVCAYEKSGYLEELTDELIDVVAEHAPRKTSPLSVMLFYRLDEAYCEAGEADTAFGGGRTPRWIAFTIGVTPVPEMLPAERSWVRALWDELGPHVMSRGTYVNALEVQEPGQVRETYGPKYERLATVKATYDPANVFHRNVNIPAPAIPTPRS